MKTTKKLLALFFVAATMTMVSCGDEKDDPEPLAFNFENTSWESELNNDFTMQGTNMHIEGVWAIDFMSQTDCEMFMEIHVSVPSMPGYGYDDSETFPCTYRYDGNTSLVITEEDVNEQTGETESYDYNFTLRYEGDELVLEMHDDDPEMEELLGTNTLVFHRIR